MMLMAAVGRTMMVGAWGVMVMVRHTVAVVSVSMTGVAVVAVCSGVRVLRFHREHEDD